MKKIFYCLSLGAMCASLALAQDTATAPSAASVDSNSSSNVNANANAGSIQGCLSGSDGNYTLTQDGTNTTFNVAGSDSLLKNHVGHEVALTGQVTSGAGDSATAPGSASEPSQAQPSQTQPSQPSATNGAAGNTIQVTDVKMVSKTCGTGPDSTPKP